MNGDDREQDALAVSAPLTDAPGPRPQGDAPEQDASKRDVPEQDGPERPDLGRDGLDRDGLDRGGPDRDDEDALLPEDYEPAPVAVPLPPDEPETTEAAQAGGPGQPGDPAAPAVPDAAAGAVPAVTHAHEAGQRPPLPDEDEPMTLLGHLGELRRRLTRVIILIFIGFFACYGVAEILYDFLSTPLKDALPVGSKLIYTSPQGAFFVYLKVSLLASVFLTSPLTFYQLWAFIAPGLYREEKRAAIPLAVLSAAFFLIGAAFCYTLVFPLAFKFFMGFATVDIVPMISVEEYLSLALKLLIAFGLVFEMPLFAFFLGRMGLLTPEFMRRNRKYAILIIFIVAAILTPPDVFSQCLMAAPMIILYEISVYVAGWARKKKLAATSDPADTPAEENPQGEPHGEA